MESSGTSRKFGELVSPETAQVLHLRRKYSSCGTMGRAGDDHLGQTSPHQTPSFAHRAGDVQGEVEGRPESVAVRRSAVPEELQPVSGDAK